MASTATIRTTNVKESKEKKNREKLLAGPGSEFSLANPEDFELDYYDYNVMNAGAAPGSYLGMDPAYLVCYYCLNKECFHLVTFNIHRYGYPHLTRAT